MKCEDCLSQIEEYFDAELNVHEAAGVAEHLLSCVTCNEVYESLQQEQQLYAHYQRDVEVTAALWQGVQASIKREAARQDVKHEAGIGERLRRFFSETFHAPRFSPALAALLMVITVGATVLVMKVVNSNNNDSLVAGGNTNTAQPAPATNRNDAAQSGAHQLAGGGNSNEQPKNAPEKENDVVNPPDKDQYAVKQDAPRIVPVRNEITPRQSPVARGSEIKPNATAEELLRDAEQKYLKAIALLQRDFNQRRSKLDPKLVAKLDASLSNIDRTIAETRKAVHQNPDDPIALQYMLTAYAKKVEVLKDVTAN